MNVETSSFALPAGSSAWISPTACDASPADSGATPKSMGARTVPAGAPSRLVQCIEEYVDTHLDSPLSVDELAATVGISRSHFSRLFGAAVGVTPHNYVMQRRLRRAQHLLVHSERSLVDIALVTGFSDQSHFSRRFHRLMGVPPRTFRRHRGGALRS